MIFKNIKFEYFFILAIALLFSTRAHYKEINPYLVYPDLASMAEYINVDNQMAFPDIFSREMAKKENMPTPLKIEGVPVIVKEIYNDNLSTVQGFKIFAVSMYLFAIFLLHTIHRKLFRRPIAITITILFSAYLLTLNTFAGGNLRCIGFCLLLLFLNCIYYKKYLFAAVVMMLNAAYPYNIPLIGILFVIKALKDFSLPKYQRNILLILLVIIGLTLINLNFAGISPLDVLSNESFKISLDYKYKLKIIGAWNDAPILNTIKHLILNFQEHSDLYSFYTIFLLFFFLFFHKKNMLIFDLIWASLISFFIVCFLTDITVASRIFLFAIPIILVLHFGYMLQHYKLDKPQKKKILIFINIVLALPFLIFFQPNLMDITRYKKTYAYLKNINNPHVLLFGHPDSVEFAPFFTRKKTFTTVKTEYSLPVKGALDYLEKKNKQIISMLYSDDLTEIKKLLKIKAITHLIIEKYYFDTKYQKSPHWAHVKYGYLKDIKMFIENNNPNKNFALYEFVKENYDFIDQDNNIYVMETKKLFDE